MVGRLISAQQHCAKPDIKPPYPLAYPIFRIQVILSQPQP
jgi:hypothetical protein